VVLLGLNSGKHTVESTALGKRHVKVHISVGTPGEEEEAPTKLCHSEVESVGLHGVGAVADQAKPVLQLGPMANMRPRQGPSHIFDHQNQRFESCTKFANERQQIISRIVWITSTDGGKSLAWRASKNCCDWLASRRKWEISRQIRYVGIRSEISLVMFDGNAVAIERCGCDEAASPKAEIKSTTPRKQAYQGTRGGYSINRHMSSLTACPTRVDEIKVGFGILPCFSPVYCSSITTI
jgi:hypothetical protein